MSLVTSLAFKCRAVAAIKRSAGSPWKSSPNPAAATAISGDGGTNSTLGSARACRIQVRTGRSSSSRPFLLLFRILRGGQIACQRLIHLALSHSQVSDKSRSCCPPKRTTRRRAISYAMACPDLPQGAGGGSHAREDSVTMPIARLLMMKGTDGKFCSLMNLGSSITLIWEQNGT